VIALLPFTKIPSKKVRPEICKHINNFIRAGSLPSTDAMYAALPDKYKQDVNLNTFTVWGLIYTLKMRLLETIEDYSNVKCFIGGKQTNHEGFVIVSSNPYKIVDRLTFSKANFNLDKNWTNEEV